MGAPTSTFVENEGYTIHLPSGERELVVELTLAEIEGEYANVYRNKIAQRQTLTPVERATMAIFTAAMLSRPRSMRTHHQAQWHQVSEKIKALEEAHGIPAGTSKAAREVQAMRPTIHADVIAVTLEAGAQYIFRMRHTYLVAAPGTWFITSDAPCSLFNPKLQGSFYGPGFG